MTEPNDSTATDRCDESRCVSRGRTELFDFSFTCYGDDDGGYYPRMCADGFVPVVIEDEPAANASSWAWEENELEIRFDPTRNVTVRYFTCCPPDHSEEEGDGILRHCSDPIDIDPLEDEEGIVDPDALDDICRDQGPRSRPVRQISSETIKRVGPYSVAYPSNDSVLCCDPIAPANEVTKTQRRSFLDDLECVPYMDKYYHSARALPNGNGHIDQITCSVPGGQFWVPRPLEGAETVVSGGAFQCCRNGDPVPPFIQDSAFGVYMVSYLVLYGLAALASIVVILGLSMPLFLQPSSHQPSSSHRKRRRRNRRPREPVPYSTYNLYLVYLAVPDLLVCLFQITERALRIRQIVLPDAWYYNRAFFCANAIANLWLNAIVLFETHALLESWKTARRIDPPSPRRVHVQTGIVYALGVFSGVVAYYCHRAVYRMGHGAGLALYAVYSSWFTLNFLATIGYGFFVGVKVCRGGYFRKGSRATAADKGTLELAVYFFRIIGVFCLVWIPILVLRLIHSVWGDSRALWISTLIWPLQPIATTGVILTKSDARKHILEFVTLSCLGCGRGAPDASSSPHPKPTTALPTAVISQPQGGSDDPTREPSPRADAESNEGDAHRDRHGSDDPEHIEC